MLRTLLAAWLGPLKSGEYLSRRVYLEVKYTVHGEQKAHDISEDITKYLLSFTYTDNMSDKADDVNLTLEDRAELWSSSWMPTAGSLLDLTIHTYNWAQVNEGEKVLPLGRFSIDEIEVSSAPATVAIKAVSIPCNSTLRGEKKNRTWEDITVRGIAQDITRENEIALFWDCDDDPPLKHVEQSDQSDLAFLQKLCKDNGFALKASNEQVIIFDEYKFEAVDPTIVIPHPASTGVRNTELHYVDGLTGYRFRFKTRDIYGKCHVKYQAGSEKEVIEGEFSDPDKQESSHILEVSQQVSDIAEAERLAKKKLREANKDEVTGSVELPGDFDFAAGLVIRVENYGRLDGRYIITKVRHAISGTFKTSIDIRRCLNGY